MSKELFMQQRELELMSQFPVSKSEIIKRADETTSALLENYNPAEVAIMLSSMEKFVEAVRKDQRIVDAVINELELNKGKIEAKGMKIEIAEVGTKYDYSSDEEWAGLDAQIKPLREKQKQREDFLKKIPPGKMLIEDGVVIGTGPAKSSTTSFKVSLSK